ncbi:unnamed protein product [Malus baccata var. baccata]
MYRVMEALDYQVITGVGIDDLKLAKKAWILSGQSCTIFDMFLVNYSQSSPSPSLRSLPLGHVLTTCPTSTKYAKLLCRHDKLSNQEETRVLAASMTMEELFRGTKKFKQEVFDKVQLELNQFGLLIYNTNVKQLEDIPSHEYFSYLGQKIQMKAANQARVNVAKTKKKGEIYKVEREAGVDATQVKVFENMREAEIAEADLQKEVEKMNALTRMEKLKGELLTEASVEYETKARLYARQQAADAEYFAKKREVQGLMALGQAQGTYPCSLLDAVRGNYAAVRDFLMINNGMFQQVAQINDDAVCSLQPKISSWTTNGAKGSDGDANGAFKKVASVYKALPPLFTTVNEQTGMLPPPWLGTLSNSPSINSTLGTSN